MRGTQQNWNLVWQEGPYDNHTAPRTNPYTQGFGIDPRLGAATLRAPAASKEDFHPQVILKFQLHNSFDYRVRYQPQLNCKMTLLTYLGAVSKLTDSIKNDFWNKLTYNHSKYLDIPSWS